MSDGGDAEFWAKNGISQSVFGSRWVQRVVSCYGHFAFPCDVIYLYGQSERDYIYIFLWLQVWVTGPRHHLAQRIWREGHVIYKMVYKYVL